MRMILALLLTFLAALPVQAAPQKRFRITSERQFAQMAATVEVGRYARFPRIMFIIDRGGKAPKAHFINARAFPFHIDYLQKSNLTFQTLEEINRVSYSEPNRRFLMGSIVHYQALGRYGVEFWEGDQLTPELVTLALRELGKGFPKPLAFKPNSAPQLDVARAVSGIAIIEPEQVFASRAVLVLNEGKAVGRLRIVDKVEPGLRIGPADIVILKETPLQLSPVAGIITSEASSPLSHVNLLAKSWQVPNAYVKDAAALHAALAGEMVMMDAQAEQVTLRKASAAEVEKARETRIRTVQIAPADLTFTGFPTLDQQRAGDAVRTGAKAANLGEVARRVARHKNPGFAVPKGASIPFHYYDQFVATTPIKAQVESLLTDPRLHADPVWRSAALSALRLAFESTPLPARWETPFVALRQSIGGASGVFVRSSTNSEDLKGFNGAGLYSSVPNVKDDAAFLTAIRTVWGSIWNDRAFDAREAAGIDHRSVKASVLVQLGINADAAGVMITENPFDPGEYGAVYINAKRGLGIRVVEGKRIAEQLLYRSEPESIQILTRSGDDAMLVFDEQGGVREVAVETNRAVLRDDVARRLARAARLVESWFGGAPQDIEWVLVGDAIHIVQTRPYLRGN